jgi:Domain of unknown function (DUF5753)/S-adenosyl methyltransferase/Helix-turn-helix domain
MSQPKISKLETGRLLPSVKDVQALLALYQATPAAREELLEITGRLHATIESNRTILRRGAARMQARLGELEHEATTLRYFSPVVLSGLLQTAEYMRRVFSLELSGAELARTALIDFSRPIAVLFVAVPHFIRDSEDPAGIVKAFR